MEEKEMKAEELQIGDWVLWKNKPVQIAQISGIKYSFGHIDVGLAHCGSGFLESHDIKSISPIPITPEILKKNGFVIKRNWAQLGNFGDSPLIMWHFEDDVTTRDFRHELEIHQLDTGKVHIRIKCDYVHQLQQLFRICGISKEIEL